MFLRKWKRSKKLFKRERETVFISNVASPSLVYDVLHVELCLKGP